MNSVVFRKYVYSADFFFRPVLKTLVEHFKKDRYPFNSLLSDFLYLLENVQCLIRFHILLL